jgi:hypothetical protein
MAAAKSVKLFPKGAIKPGAKAAAAPPTTGDFALVDNGDQTFTVGLIDQAGNPVPADPTKTTLAVLSDTLATIVADFIPAAGQPSPLPPMTFAVHVPAAPAPAVGAKAKVTVTATWTDGSVGPFSFVLNETITASPAGGIVPTPGAVTTH